MNATAYAAPMTLQKGSEGETGFPVDPRECFKVQGQRFLY